MSAVGKAFQAMGEGIGKAFTGIAQIARGVLTLNPSEIAKGTCNIASAGMDALRQHINMLPASMAANTLLDGALDKVMCRVQNTVEQKMQNNLPR